MVCATVEECCAGNGRGAGGLGGDCTSLCGHSATEWEEMFRNSHCLIEDKVPREEEENSSSLQCFKKVSVWASYTVHESRRIPTISQWVQPFKAKSNMNFWLSELFSFLLISKKGGECLGNLLWLTVRYSSGVFHMDYSDVVCGQLRKIKRTYSSHCGWVCRSLPVQRSVTPVELSSGKSSMLLCEQTPEFLQWGP